MLAAALPWGALTDSSPSCLVNPTLCNDYQCLTNVSGLGCTAYGTTCRTVSICQAGGNAWSLTNGVGICDPDLASLAGRWYNYTAWTLQVQ